jgi:hypothetical protein
MACIRLGSGLSSNPSRIAGSEVGVRSNCTHESGGIGNRSTRKPRERTQPEGAFARKKTARTNPMLAPRSGGRCLEKERQRWMQPHRIYLTTASHARQYIVINWIEIHTELLAEVQRSQALMHMG